MKIKNILMQFGILLLSFAFLFACKPNPDPGGEETEYVTVTFDTDSGAPEPADIEVEKGKAMGTQYPANPVKAGFTFGGWWNSNKRYYNYTVINTSGTLALSAKWIETGSPATSWQGLTIPNETLGYTYPNMLAKNDVLLVKPNGTEHNWSVVHVNLNSYGGKKIKIEMSVDMYLDTEVIIAWQAHLGGSYPTIAGNHDTPVSQINQWVTIQGMRESLTVPAGGGTFYLSGGASNGRLENKPVDIYMANFTLTITEETAATSAIKITLGDKRDLSALLPGTMTGAITWTSSNSALVSVDSSGVASAKDADTGKTARYNTGGGNTLSPTSTPATGRVTITATAASGIHTFDVYATTEAQINASALTPLKEQFENHFMIGNIFRGNEVNGTGAGAQITDTNLTRHFNAITAENLMKPSYLITGRNTTTGVFTWNNDNLNRAKNFVDAAHNSGMHVVGHTILWHSQNPNWIWEQIGTKAGEAKTTKENALSIMEKYITDYVTAFKGKIDTWDVLNEIFPDNAGGSVTWDQGMRKAAAGEGQDANPWYAAIGSDFVYYGYLYARRADPDAVLYYNDYNTDSTNRARLIADMVKAVNDRYLSGTDKPIGEAAGRLLIEGIGMQEHHNLGVTAASIRNTLDKFTTLTFGSVTTKLKISVSELDIISYPSYSSFTAAVTTGSGKNHQSTVTNNQLIAQADLYKSYMKVYMEYAAYIERVSLWGITDDISWRSGGLPLLFDHAGRAKPAYYSFVGALE